ncbi:MAG: pyruvate dehydrogenase E2 component (dihydrolipoamide acetyltransferase) [Candidatus Aldehydirespiratoraceae bacterium]|jgi:pyruvate dehydrogenase E2 component (dihydrolipoamide acetyltransferase)
MATEFLMPKLGLTMEAGTIIDWLVDDGADVEQGSSILNIETDKVESEVEASASGRIHFIGSKGDSFPCGEVIGWFLAEGEEPPAAPAPVVAAAPTVAATPTASIAPSAVAAPSAIATPILHAGGRLLASPNAKRVAAERGVDLRRVAGSGPGGRIVSEDVIAAPVGGNGPYPATIAARQLADLLGVDLAAVAPAGTDPRVDREDVARYVRQRLAERAAPAPASTAPASPPARPLVQTPTSTVPLTGMRGTIASRMHQSLQEMAQLTLTMDVVMDAVVADRSGRDGDRPGYTDYVIAAVAQALAAHPIVNSQVHEGTVALLPDVNVGVAVALDGGLVVPVVSGANLRSIEDLSTETTRLATAARDGKLVLADLEGGTFSVTALGMFGVDGFTPVINPPNTAILGIGRLRETVRWDDATPVKTTVLTLSLTWDHRAFDGAPAAEFTATVRDNLEQWGAPGGGEN